MVKIVSVKFKNGGKTYYFAPGKDKYEKGMGVIVETAKGLEYATVVLPEGEVEDDQVVSPLKPVIRIATAKDEEQVKRNRERRGEAMKIAQEKIAARELDMKLVDCEFAFDGSKVAFFFTSENRVDFRELIKDLSSAFHMRIELRQISIREEIKLTGGLAPCGRECCCIGSIQEPAKVSVKMAKNQGLSLNPSKISGLCGRLMCCLSYENDYYAEACKKVPKVGSTIETPEGTGMVVNVNMLKMLVKVKVEKNEAVTYHDFTVDELNGIPAPAPDDDEDYEEVTSDAEDMTEPQGKKSERENDRPGKDGGKNRNKNRNKGSRNENGERSGQGERREGGKRHGDGQRDERNAGQAGGDGQSGEAQDGQFKGGKHRNKNRNKGDCNENGERSGQGERREGGKRHGDGQRDERTAGQAGGDGQSGEAQDGQFKGGKHRNKNRHNNGNRNENGERPGQGERREGGKPHNDGQRKERNAGQERSDGQSGEAQSSQFNGGRNRHRHKGGKPNQGGGQPSVPPQN